MFCFSLNLVLHLVFQRLGNLKKDYFFQKYILFRNSATDGAEFNGRSIPEWMFRKLLMKKSGFEIFGLNLAHFLKDKVICFLFKLQNVFHIFSVLS